MKSWTHWAPVLGVLTLAVTWSWHPTVVLIPTAVVLGAAVLAAVHHAEVVAHRVGEPFGSLVLAVAVTVIEVALIVTLMIAGGKDTSTLARDTVFAAFMITTTGIVGLSLLTATLHHSVATFSAEGTASALATVATLAVLTLVVPAFTTSRPEPEFSGFIGLLDKVPCDPPISHIINYKLVPRVKFDISNLYAAIFCAFCEAESSELPDPTNGYYDTARAYVEVDHSLRVVEI